MRRGRPRHDDILTPREWQVLRLIRDGLTNEQIAGRLGISLSAAKYHVSEILSKLEVSSRHEAARHAGDPRRGVLAALPLAWLKRPLVAGRRTGVTFAAGASVIALVILALLLGAPWSRGGLPGDELASATDSPFGPDLATEGLEEYEQARLASPYQHTVLVAQTLPSDYSLEDLALLQSLPRVSSLAQLQAILTPQINLIVVDSSVAAEFEDNDFLYQQLQTGRAVMELNVCLEQINFRGLVYPVKRSAGTVTEISPSGQVRQVTVDPAEPVAVNFCALPLNSLDVPRFGYRRLPTEAELAPMRHGEALHTNHGRVLANSATGALKVVLMRLDAGREGNVMEPGCGIGQQPPPTPSPDCP